MRLLLLISSCLLVLCSADFCGTNKVPYGFEAHKDGGVALLCTRPECHEKKFADCPERAEEKQCLRNTSWVGGLQKRADGKLELMCCDYDLLPKYGQLIYENVLVRPGEFFEGEEKKDQNDEVIAFDLITNIHKGRDIKGEFYSLRIHRFDCGKIPDKAPLWYKHKQWPFWPREDSDKQL
ncbi:hypothetical protein WR25_09992 [Diploscapter pachys]|uniref:WxxW domain-containing protein n=1 Tax=Diploscapter pachys TaxID=2018661 RepID=A0A2A2KFG1_9BILA|nr:hypothetical protein WR25_09992 [Diploscapter pachys]